MDKPKKIRLDTFLVEQGFFESRARAQAAIMAGQVLVDEQTGSHHGGTGAGGRTENR